MTPCIKVLGLTTNHKGDLFARLMKDLFLALGYDENIRLNIHKTGREIDIETVHRVERKRAVAECKAEATPVGGDQVNKFVGSLGLEKRKSRRVQTVGYFVSLSGFKESALEQEKEAGDSRVILLDGARVVEELSRGRIIVSPDRALERAGRCVASVALNLTPEEGLELLAHDLGWIWAIFYENNKQRTHFAFVHADGMPLASDLAAKVVGDYDATGGSLQGLTYLAPPSEVALGARLEEARARYFRYIALECGEIQMEGLPADQEVGSRRLQLENLFVPLQLEKHVSSLEPQRQTKRERIAVGEVLSTSTCLAILAAPGGGKSTLLKRLAVAYAFTNRRHLVDDNLPEQEWLPLFVRCRQLGTLVREPITRILYAIPERAEMSHLADAFQTLVDTSLQRGDALLLIDGLDEISDGQSRMAFVSQLRTFLATYPNTKVVITSREAGFRVVSGSLASHCDHYTLADFTDADIRRLTLAWHKEVVGDRPDVEQEAQRLATAICQLDRVRTLATNPLLLTTLLLVKRWVGQLPTRRSVLYGKAIEVLLMTWNVEGYEPLDQEEVIPQLAFVAFQMMNDGVQRITARRLKELLHLARKQMPEILSYARLGINEFVESVELRSSILMLSGYTVDEGTLYPEYEFRHLTFQEYLTARAIVEGFYPDRKDSDTIVELLKPHLLEANLREVVPLTAVLAGRKSHSLIEHLTAMAAEKPSLPRTQAGASQAGTRGRRRSQPHMLLAQCLIDEVLIPPDTLKQALSQLAKRRLEEGSSYIYMLADGRYGQAFRGVLRETYIKFEENQSSLGSVLGRLFLRDSGHGSRENLSEDVRSSVYCALGHSHPLERAVGLLAVMRLAFESARLPSNTVIPPDTVAWLKQFGDMVVQHLNDEHAYVRFAACWALCWLGLAGVWAPSAQVIARLLEIWRTDSFPDRQRQAAWAISALPILTQGCLGEVVSPTRALIEFVEDRALNSTNSPEEKEHNLAALILGYYLGEPWSDEALAALISEGSQRRHVINSRYLTLLQQLGPAGQSYLEKLEQLKKDERDAGTASH